MHAYKKKDANPQKGIDSQGISIEKTGYCRGNFRLTGNQTNVLDGNKRSFGADPDYQCKPRIEFTGRR